MSYKEYLSSLKNSLHVKNDVKDLNSEIKLFILDNIKKLLQRKIEIEYTRSTSHLVGGYYEYDNSRAINDIFYYPIKKYYENENEETIFTVYELFKKYIKYFIKREYQNWIHYKLFVINKYLKKEKLQSYIINLAKCSNFNDYNQEIETIFPKILKIDNRFREDYENKAKSKEDKDYAIGSYVPNVRANSENPSFIEIEINCCDLDKLTKISWYDLIEIFDEKLVNQEIEYLRQLQYFEETKKHYEQQKQYFEETKTYNEEIKPFNKNILWINIMFFFFNFVLILIGCSSLIWK